MVFNLNNSSPDEDRLLFIWHWLFITLVMRAQAPLKEKMLWRIEQCLSGLHIVQWVSGILVGFFFACLRFPKAAL